MAPPGSPKRPTGHVESGDNSARMMTTASSALVTPGPTGEPEAPHVGAAGSRRGVRAIPVRLWRDVRSRDDTLVAVRKAVRVHHEHE